MAIHDVETDRPQLTYQGWAAQAGSLVCDFIAGCDGYHGISRKFVPAPASQTFERVYPFGWLGILADVPPCSAELIYASHERGFRPSLHAVAHP